MLIPTLIAVAVILAALIINIAMRPDSFSVCRSAVVTGPPEQVFQQVNELRNWEAWSPWAKIDPMAVTSYDGPASGVGALFSWAGNSKIGEGRMVIVESRLNELVRLRLDFQKPFKASHDAEFRFKPRGDHTLVSWTMSGKTNFFTKALSLVVNCENMVGSQFEQGLADLKSVVTKTAERQSALK